MNAQRGENNSEKNIVIFVFSEEAFMSISVLEFLGSQQTLPPVTVNFKRLSQKRHLAALLAFAGQLAGTGGH